MEENGLTTMMVTHNMKDAIVHGNRLIMMYDGRIVIDVSGEEKKKLTVPDLLACSAKSAALTKPTTSCCFPEPRKPDSNCMVLPGRAILPGVVLAPDFISLKQQKRFVQNHG